MGSAKWILLCCVSLLLVKPIAAADAGDGCAFTQPVKLSADELQSLQQREVPQLERTVAFGKKKVATTLIWYIPNILLDTADCISLGIGLGAAIGGDIHITRYAGLGLGLNFVLIQPEWFFNRNLSCMTMGYGWGWQLGPYRSLSQSFGGTGTNWKDGKSGSGRIKFKESGFFKTSNADVRQGYSDPYGIGLGWNVELHPVELVDLVGDIVTLGFIDISRDDIGQLVRRPIKSYMR